MANPIAPRRREIHRGEMRMLALLLLIGIAARAEVTLAPLFGEHAVLQRDKALPIWGRADPGERVTVRFKGQEISATADGEGRWLVVLEPIPGSSESSELIAAGKSSTAQANDVVVGDVWLCSGQSNMEWPVSLAQNAAQEIAAANAPLIRHIKIKRAVSDTPAKDLEGAWSPANPNTVGDFSAIGYFFARELQPRLNVPIGVVNSTWGGTPIESWLSSFALASDPAFAVVGERWKKALADYPNAKQWYDNAFAAWKAEEAAAKKRGDKFTKPQPWEPSGPGSPWTPSGLFNGMINPLLPCGLRGFLWYQGESNTPHANEYTALFKTLITSWRGHFGQGNLPFLWVQLANYKGDDPYATDWARLREAQAHALALPATGQAITIDIGDRNDIHPRNKQEVGRRLALIARSEVYGQPVDFSGPTFLNATPEGSAMRVRFAHAGTGLTARNRPLQSFQVAGADRKFYPATARVDRDTVLVSAPQVRTPVAVRYAWFNAPDANLYNGAGLPAAPFRSDDW